MWPDSSANTCIQNNKILNISIEEGCANWKWSKSGPKTGSSYFAFSLMPVVPIFNSYKLGLNKTKSCKSIAYVTRRATLKDVGVFLFYLHLKNF